MKKMLRFEDLDIWKESMRICTDVYSVMKPCKDFGFKDQIQRAAVSVPSNIAEGYERKGTKENIQFLYIAKGSCGELRTQLYLAISLEYIAKETGSSLIEQCVALSIKIYHYIQSLRSSDRMDKIAAAQR